MSQHGRAPSRSQPSRAARESQTTGPERINAEIDRNRPNPTRPATTQPAIIFAQPPIVSPQSRRVPGAFGNVTVEAAQDPEEPTIVPPIRDEENTYRAWGGDTQPTELPPHRPVSSFHELPLAPSRLSETSYHPATGTYLPVTSISRALTARSTSPAHAPLPSHLRGLPHIGFPINRQRFALNAPHRHMTVSPPTRAPTRTLHQSPSPTRDIHSQLQALVDQNGVLRADIIALQGNYATTWREAHEAHVLATDERQRSQQGLAFVNELRERVNRFGDTLTGVGRRQDDQERFMEELAAQVNRQEGELEHMKRHMGYQARPESVRSIEREPASHSPILSFHEAVHSTTRQEGLPKKARYQLPEPFEGRRKGGEAETFAIKMDMFFSEYPVFEEEPYRKISQFLSRMKEGSEAGKWAQPLLKRFALRPRGPHTAPLSSYPALREAFLAAFDNPLKKDKASRDIRKLTQTGSAQNYTNQFRSLAEELGWDETALKDQYRAGLKPEVEAEILRAGITHNVEGWNLEQLIRFVINSDDILYRTKAMTRDITPKKPSFQGKAGAETEKPTRIPDAVVKLRMKEGRCIKCGKPGHKIPVCPVKGRQFLPEPVKAKEGRIEEVDEEEEASDTETASSKN
jgi:hypothetical protein